MAMKTNAATSNITLKNELKIIILRFCSCYNITAQSSNYKHEPFNHTHISLINNELWFSRKS